MIRKDAMLLPSSTSTQIRSLTLPSHAMLPHYQVAGTIVDDITGYNTTMNSDHTQYYHDDIIDEYRPCITRDQSPGPSVRRRTYGTTTAASQVSSASSAVGGAFASMDSSDDYDGEVEYSSGGATKYIDSTLNDGYYQEDYDEWSLHCAPTNQTKYDLGQYEDIDTIESDAVYSVGETRDVIFGQTTPLSMMTTAATDLYGDYDAYDGEDVSLDY